MKLFRREQMYCYMLALMSAVLLGTVFPRLNLWVFSFVGLVPLLLAIRECSPFAAFLRGYVMGCLYFIICSYWLTDTLVSYGDMPLEIAYLIFILMILSLALYMGIFCFFISYARKKWDVPFYLTAPPLMVILEWIRGYATVGFPWNNMGYSLYQRTTLIQIVDITSVYGLTWWIVLTNCALFHLFFEIKDRKSRYYPIIAAGCVLILFCGYGTFRLNEDIQSTPVNVAVLQGNVGIDEKWDPRFRDTIIDTYIDLTEKAAQLPSDLIIWPEAALPTKLKYNAGIRTRIFQIANKLQTYLIVSSTDLDLGTDEYYNAAFLISPYQKIDATYRKIRLVPFGEYVPWKKIFFFIDKITDAYGTFYSGKIPVVMNVGDKFNASVFICYETLFPALLRKFVHNGADLLINITNDAWFGKTAAPYHHFALLTFRAIENRVPIARAANSGISGFIDSSGRILDTSGLFVKTHMNRTLNLDPRTTFYSTFGDLFVYLCIVVLAYYIIQTIRRK